MRNGERILGFTGFRWWWLVVAGVPAVGSLWFEAPVFLLAMVLVGVGHGLAERGGEVTASPLSFNLPGYREALRLRHLIESGVIGLGLAPWPLLHALTEWEIVKIWAAVKTKASVSEGPEVTAVVLAMVAVFAGGAGLHMAAKALSYAGSRWSMGFDLAILSLYGLVLFAPLGAAKHPAIAWLWLLPVGLTLGALAWVRMGDPGMIRQGHRTAIQKELAPCAKPLPTRQTRESRAEAFFRGRMERCDYFRAGRFCRGELRRVFAPPLYFWRTELICLAVGVLILGFLGTVGIGQGFVLLGLLAFCPHPPLAPGQILLLPAGRRERRLATLAIAACASGMLAVVGVVAIAISWPLGLFISLLPLDRLVSVTFLKIAPAWFYWPCLLVPWATVSKLVGGWARRTAQGFLVVVALILVAGVYALHYAMIPAWRLHVVYVCVWATGWLLLIAALRARSRTGDLLAARGG